MQNAVECAHPDSSLPPIDFIRSACWFILLGARTLLGAPVLRLFISSGKPYTVDTFRGKCAAPHRWVSWVWHRAQHDTRYRFALLTPRRGDNQPATVCIAER